MLQIIGRATAKEERMSKEGESLIPSDGKTNFDKNLMEKNDRQRVVRYVYGDQYEFKNGQKR